MKFNILDIVLLGIGIIIILKVTFRGFIAEFFSMAAFLLAAATAFHFYRPLAMQMKFWDLPQAAMKLIAFFAVFIAIFIAVKLLQMMIAAVFQNEILRSLDRALGIFLGIFEAYVVIIIILAFLQLQPFVKIEDLFTDSMIVRTLEPLPIDSGAAVRIFRNNI